MMKQMKPTGFMATFRRELQRMGSRKIYLFILIVVPIGMALFFVSLLDKGLPLETPVAVVDLDHSSLSRRVTRSLDAEELLTVTERLESFSRAMEKVKSGKIFGFFVIPVNFEADAIGGRTPVLEYYSNMTYFVPGTLSFKGFKTIAVGTSASTVSSTLIALGVDPQQLASLVQPVNFDIHQIGNPWTNYSYYLSPSFVVAVLALMIYLTTVFAITSEIKSGSSPDWIATAGGRMSTALLGKLAPYSIAFSVVGLFILSLFLGYRHFPMAGSLAALGSAMVLMVLASQAFATLVCCAVPNPRLAMSVVSLIGILTFSFAGFSFPVEKMYGYIAVLSYLVPVRHFFEIYVNEALLGAHVWFCRWMFVGLLVFLPLPALLARRLKKACLNPVYVP